MFESSRANCQLFESILITIILQYITVLPQTRLNVNGFKQRYSLDDRVELACSSDFTRPRAALAWFVNGQRVSVQARNLTSTRTNLRKQTRSNIQIHNAHNLDC